MSTKKWHGSNIVVNNLVYGYETEKAFMIIPLFKIEQKDNIDRITDWRDAHDFTHDISSWLPKSMITEVNITEKEIFPNLTKIQPSLMRPEITPFKYVLSAKIPMFLIAKHKLTEEAEQEIDDENLTGW